MSTTVICEMRWDTEGQTLEECKLPAFVIVSNVPSDFGAVVEDVICELISESFGFRHYGFNMETLKPTHAGGGFFKNSCGFCEYPNP